MFCRTMVTQLTEYKNPTNKLAPTLTPITAHKRTYLGMHPHKNVKIKGKNLPPPPSLNLGQGVTLSTTYYPTYVLRKERFD